MLFELRSLLACLAILTCMFVTRTYAHDLQESDPKYQEFPAANPPYYRVQYSASNESDSLQFAVNYTIWIPESVDTIRGIVVHQHGCGVGSCSSGLTGAYDLHWQALARKHDFALLSPAYEQPDGADCQLWCDPRNGSSQAFLNCLEDLANQSGHSELTTVPWALWGHSGGGHWVGGMVMLYPHRVVAAWLRSGVPFLRQDADRPDIRPHQLTDPVLKVPMMCNLGTKEGVTDKTGRFARVWPSNKQFFETVRGRKGQIGIAVDPLTAHECGNQRYLAIPWLDTCISLRLSGKLDGSNQSEPSLQPIGEAAAWLAEVNSVKAIPAAAFEGDPLKAIWLPNRTIAKSWMQYVLDTSVGDTTPPPSPTNIRLQDGILTWEAQADVESGLEGFIIESDGKIIHRVGGNNRFGRPVFQNLQYSDTPVQPLEKMQFTHDSLTPGADYRVISVNTAGLHSSDEIKN